MAQMTLQLGADYSSAVREAGKVVRGLKETEKAAGDVAKAAKTAGDALEVSAKKAFREWIGLQRAFQEGAKQGQAAGNAIASSTDRMRERMRAANAETGKSAGLFGAAGGGLGGFVGIAGKAIAPIVSLAAAWRVVNDAVAENEARTIAATEALRAALPAIVSINKATGGNLKLNVEDRARGFQIAEETGTTASQAAAIVAKAREEGVPQAAAAYAKGEVAGIPGVAGLEAYGKAAANFPGLGPETFLNLAIAQQQKTGAPVDQVLSAIEALGPAAKDAGIDVPTLLALAGKFTEGTTKKAAVGQIKGLLETYAGGATKEGKPVAGFAAAAAEVDAARRIGAQILPASIEGEPLAKLYGGAIATPEIMAQVEFNKATTKKQRAENDRAIDRMRLDAAQADLDAAEEEAGTGPLARYGAAAIRNWAVWASRLMGENGDAIAAGEMRDRAQQLRDGDRANLSPTGRHLQAGGNAMIDGSVRILEAIRDGIIAMNKRRDPFQTLDNPGGPGRQ